MIGMLFKKNLNQWWCSSRCCIMNCVLDDWFTITYSLDIKIPPDFRYIDDLGDIAQRNCFKFYISNMLTDTNNYYDRKLSRFSFNSHICITYVKLRYKMLCPCAFAYTMQKDTISFDDLHNITAWVDLCTSVRLPI